jgi:hypothetical protein
MPISNKFTWLTCGLVLLLAACSSTTVSQPEPVEEPAPVVEVEKPVVATVEVPPVEAEVVVEEAAVLEVMEEEADTMETAVEEVTPPEVTEVPGSEEAVVEEDTVVAEEPTVTEAPTEAISGPSPEQMQILSGLDDLGQPPELNNEIWLNSDPLKLAELHGKVVVVEFWTFG